MGVFDALPVDGSPATATALSDELGVEKDLLGIVSAPGMSLEH
jgi:hypothetical protein